MSCGPGLPVVSIKATEVVVCPHCGERHPDSSRIFEGADMWMWGCVTCKGEFRVGLYGASREVEGSCA